MTPMSLTAPKRAGSGQQSLKVTEAQLVLQPRWLHSPPPPGLGLAPAGGW